jgi:hypothetical protein
MKFSLVFDNSGDILPFEVAYNHELFEFFVDRANKEAQNSFSNQQQLIRDIDKKITQLHWALSKTNEVLPFLIGKLFQQQTNLENYLNQDFLNNIHCDWVFSQEETVDINKLRFNSDSDIARIGNQLHEVYPDDIRIVKVGEALKKLGYIFPYEEINQVVHQIESAFCKSNLEFSAEKKWEVFSNPFKDTMTTNNSLVNFSFGYTYVGRQYYNKFEYFDDDLNYNDHYNYETLEFSFQLSLQRAQTVNFSPEAQAWAKERNIKLVANQVPIANIPNLKENLFEYRKMLYRNSRDNNRAKIVLN